jgi:DNA polymerase
VELIQPKVICTLGNFSTKLLRADPTGISRLHGRDEVRTIGTRAIRLLPMYHPAAALYTPSNLQTLRDDFARIPELLGLDPPPQPEPVVDSEPETEVEVEAERVVAEVPETEPEPEPAPGPKAGPPPDPGDAQLGLF